MRPPRLEAIALAGIVTVFAVLLVAGHSRWAGPEIIYLTPAHGVNRNDVWVVLAWGLALWLCWRLGRARKED